MAYEVRRVPPDWQHPKKEVWSPRDSKIIEIYIPLFDEDFQSYCKKWLVLANQFLEGKYIEQEPGGKYAEELKLPNGEPDLYKFSTGCEDIPNPEKYRQRIWSPEEATVCQVYEIFSAGTPHSPVFTNKKQVLQWLLEVEHYKPDDALAMLQNEFNFLPTYQTV